MSNKKMTGLSIINAENFSSGSVKRPNAANLAAISTGIPVESLLPVFKSQGYSMRVGKFDPSEIVLLVMEHSKKDKTSRNVITTTINQIVTLKPDKFNAWQADNLFTSAQTAKLVVSVSKKLFDYPVFLLGELGLYPKENTVALLAALLSAKYDLNDGEQTAIAMAQYIIDRPTLKTESLSKIVSYIETAAIRDIRKAEYQDKKAKKLLASAPIDDEIYDQQQLDHQNSKF